MFKEKYKECDPVQTVSKIKSILKKHEISIEEVEWWNRSNTVLPKSVTVKLKGLPFSVNGKGVTEDYALASAYGELMERLQNISCLRSKFRYSSSSEFYLKYTDRVSVNKINFNYLENLRFFGYPFSVVKNALFKTDDDKLGMIKYVHVNSRSLVYLPDELISYSGSNGMCAGNSCAESLIEGLCEVFERHVLKKIYTSHIEPLPIIPVETIKNSHLYATYQNFVSLGYELTIRDCSIGLGLPVVGLFVHKDNLMRFNLGSAPDFYLALERCFTELLQGKDFNEFTDNLMENCHSPQTNDFWKREFLKSFTSYSGAFRMQLLDNSSSRSPCVFSYRKENNPETLKCLLDLLLSKNIDVFFRDVFFLGFPSYHVYVPSFSDVIDFNLDDLQTQRSMSKATDTLLNLKNASNSDINFLITCIHCIMNNHIKKNEYVSMILGMPITIENQRVDINILLCFLNFYVGNFKDSLHYIQLVDNESLACLHSVISEFASGVSFDEIKHLNADKFSDELNKEILSMLTDRSILSNYFFTLKNDFDYTRLSDFCVKMQNLIYRYDFNQLDLMNFICSIIL